MTTQVRDAARNVQTNAKRVDATRSSRVLAERRLEAEEKKYQAGMTQNFFVLQAQRDLNVARNNELLALVEYAKSVVNYSAVQQAPLFGGGQQLSSRSSSSDAVSITVAVPVTATVITFNEAANIQAALESLSWADEIIVVDSESTDDTVAIARQFTDHVIVRPWPGYIAQKNFAAEQAAHDWIFSLDADERVTPELAARDQGACSRGGPRRRGLSRAARDVSPRPLDAIDRLVSRLPAAPLRSPPRAMGRAGTCMNR